MASVYVHLSGRDIENKILELNGLKPSEKQRELMKTRKCLRCEFTNDPSSQYCCKCGMVLDEKEALKLKDVEPADCFNDFLQELYKGWRTSKMASNPFLRVTEVE